MWLEDLSGSDESSWEQQEVGGAGAVAGGAPTGRQVCPVPAGSPHPRSFMIRMRHHMCCQLPQSPCRTEENNLKEQGKLLPLQNSARN